jgi:hypothetical protein
MKTAFLSLCLFGIVAVAIASSETREQGVRVGSPVVSAQLDDCDSDCDD